MTPEQFVAVLVAFAAVLAGIAQVIREIRTYHHAVNGKMDQLLALTATSSHAEGKLEGELSPVGEIPTARSGLLPSQRAGRLPPS